MFERLWNVVNLCECSRMSVVDTKEEIKNFMLSHGIKQHQVAEKTGVSQSYISQFLHQVCLVRLSSVLCHVFHVKWFSRAFGWKTRRGPTSTSGIWMRSANEKVKQCWNNMLTFDQQYWRGLFSQWGYCVSAKQQLFTRQLANECGQWQCVSLVAQCRRYQQRSLRPHQQQQHPQQSPHSAKPGSNLTLSLGK